MEKLAVIVPIPLLSHRNKVFWGVEQPSNSQTINRIIRNRKNAGLNPVNAFNIALQSGADIVFVADDRRVEIDPELKIPVLPRVFMLMLKEQVALDRISTPPEHLSFNKLCFSEDKLYNLGKHSKRLPSECGTAFYLLLETLQRKEIKVCIPTMCEVHVKNASAQYKKSNVNIEITNFK